MSDLDALMAHRAAFPGVTTLAVTIPNETPPKRRARHSEGRTYSLDTKVEGATGWRMRAAFGRPPLTGPLALTVFCYRRTNQPCDIDNLVKHVMDAGNKVLWDDDRQVVGLLARKYLAHPHPRTVVVVSSMPEDPC